MSVETSIDATLERITAQEDRIGAWAWLDAEGAMRRARALDRSGVQGPLHGMPIGIKDVIATADMPTEYNSPIYAGNQPQQDAEVVRRLRQAGAVILGKTVTTEFAFMAPGKTRNPHDLRCTPGGSSSGSAAAVAARMVPVALTTQTGGSTIRPAAYCGVIGYKPAFDRYPTAGLKYLAPSLDTIGLHADTLEHLAQVSAVLAGEAYARPDSLREPPRFVLLRGYHAELAESQAVERLEQVARLLGKDGATVRSIELPPLLVRLDPLHRVIMSSEVSRSFAAEWQTARDRLSPELADFIAQGLAYSDAGVTAARVQLAEAARVFAELLREGEFLLTLPAPGEAPLGFAFTGNSAFNRIWTMLHAACLTLPAGRGERGLPLGIQLVGNDRSDASYEAQLLASARWVQDRLAEPVFETRNNP
jgi:Asp-tRNA(Asn)/Glu-tRNA(Gln) amidotransferase A subunit family amidase